MDKYVENRALLRLTEMKGRNKFILQPYSTLLIEQLTSTSCIEDRVRFLRGDIKYRP